MSQWRPPQIPAEIGPEVIAGMVQDHVLPAGDAFNVGNYTLLMNPEAYRTTMALDMPVISYRSSVYGGALNTWSVEVPTGEDVARQVLVMPNGLGYEAFTERVGRQPGTDTFFFTDIEPLANEPKLTSLQLAGLVRHGIMGQQSQGYTYVEHDRRVSPHPLGYLMFWPRIFAASVMATDKPEINESREAAGPTVGLIDKLSEDLADYVQRLEDLPDERATRKALLKCVTRAIRLSSKAGDDIEFGDMVEEATKSGIEYLRLKEELGSANWVLPVW